MQMDFNKKLVIYTDGGSRGNPGRAAIGYVIGDKVYGEKIGLATNNVAEYKAIVAAMKKAKSLLGKQEAKKTSLEIRMDSQLAARQLGGLYKVENPDIQPLFLAAWNLRLDFKDVKFVHVPREQNKKADEALNRALDAK